jgi:uncharacterized membrane protein
MTSRGANRRRRADQKQKTPRESAVATTNRPLATSPALCAALIALSMGGFLISLYLTLAHFRNIVPPCYVTSGCESVITSRFSVIAGVPLALIGTVFFVITFYMGIALLVGFRPRLARAYEVLVYAGLLAAICLFLLQAVVLRAFCSYCIATEIIILLMWAGSFALTSSRKHIGGEDLIRKSV